MDAKVRVEGLENVSDTMLGKEMSRSLQCYTLPTALVQLGMAVVVITYQLALFYL